ncbi:LysR family transcriptional regulator [Caballeronia sp. KNU42]
MTRQHLNESVAVDSRLSPPHKIWRHTLTMKLHQLRALVAIADTGSIRNAARATDLSPAAITKAIRELEEDLNVTLIIREATGVTLTEAGQTLLGHARLTVGQLARARQEMERLSGKRDGTLSIAAVSWVGLTLLGEVVGLFQTRMPEVKIEFFEGLATVSIPRLRDGTLDISIGRASPVTQTEEFTHVPLFRTGYAVVARAEHRLAACRSLHELKDAEWILNRDSSVDELAADNAFTEYCRMYEPRIHISHSSAIALGLVASTNMLTLMPWPLAELLVSKERLAVLPLVDSIAEAEVSLIYRRGAPLSNAAKYFVECLTSVIRASMTSEDPLKRRLFHSVECLL